MKKDKEWLKKEAKKYYYLKDLGVSSEPKIMAREIEKLIDQLDEPEKVVIPQFVDEREPEKRYRLKSKHFDSVYLMIRNGKNYPYVFIDYKGRKDSQVFFTESELETMDLTGFKKVEVTE